MIPRKMIVLAATAVALLLAGCAGVKGGVPPNLVGTAWLVEDLENAGVIDRLQSTLEFPQEGQAAGNLGCNRFTAGFTQSGPLLSFGMLAATRRMCPPAIMDQEQRFSDVLGKTRGSLLEVDVLYLLDARGAKLARLTRMQPQRE
jgi:heat shock protein HslJ